MHLYHAPHCSRWGRRNRRLPALLAPAILLAVLGCREDAFGPTEPAATATDPASTSDQSITSDMAVAAQNTWTRRADMWGTERTSMAVAVVPNASRQSVVYAIGGATATGSTVSRVMAYNAATNVWTLKAPLPVPLKDADGASVIGGKIYVSGGLTSANDQSYSTRLFEYNPATDTWSRKSDMPVSGLNGFSGVIDGRIYVVTSCQNDDNCEYAGTYLLRYDPASDTWTKLATPTASIWYRNRLVGGTIGKKIYIGTPGSSTLHVYDPQTNTWTQRETSLTIRYNAASTTLNAKLYMIGGVNPDGWATVRTTSVYDPASNTWTTKAPLPSPRSGMSAVRLAVNGEQRIELVGGPRPGNNLQYVP